MGEWYTNPLVWIGLLSLLAVAVGLIFGLGQWKGKVDSDRDTFKRTLDAFMVEIRADIKRIFERLPAPEPVAGASPLRLTELGRSLSERLGASAWAEEQAPLLLDRVADASAYDIQVFAYKYAKDEFTPDPAMEARIKQCAFDTGLQTDKVLDVLAIELRDRLLRLRHLESEDPPEESPRG